MNETNLLILAALASRPSHGYDVGKTLTKLSGGQLGLSVGALHGAIHRLAAQGLIEPDRQETVNGRLRRYFRLTEHGVQALANDVERLRQRLEVGEATSNASRQRKAKEPVGSAAPAGDGLSHAA